MSELRYLEWNILYSTIQFFALKFINENISIHLNLGNYQGNLSHVEINNIFHNAFSRP